MGAGDTFLVIQNLLTNFCIVYCTIIKSLNKTVLHSVLTPIKCSMREKNDGLLADFCLIFCFLEKMTAFWLTFV